MRYSGRKMVGGGIIEHPSPSFWKGHRDEKDSDVGGSGGKDAKNKIGQTHKLYQLRNGR